MNEICAAARRLAGGRLSIQWRDRDLDITFVRDKGWFWVTYDAKARCSLACGRAATLEAACEQAMDAGTPALAAE